LIGGGWRAAWQGGALPGGWLAQPG
jgi:hypothetical protein